MRLQAVMNQLAGFIIRFFAPVSGQTISAMLKALDQVQASGSDRVTLLLSTGGGATDQGITAHNYLRACPLKVTSVNMGQVASIGSAIYCAGESRLTMPNARFGFHPNTFNINNQRLGINQLEEKANQLRVEHEAIASIVSAATNLSFDDARSLINEHRSLTATDAKECGLAHKIEEYFIADDSKIIDIPS